jgi:hypothetical protein
MLPPSDSFRHQELKLAEALSNIQAIEVPPPSYTLMPVTDGNWNAYTTDEEEDEDECLTPLAPITIHIDASIRVDGQANTVILPPTNPTFSGLSPGAPGPGRTARAGQARAERLTSTILAALKEAGVVGADSGRGQRPLELHVNASVHVNGEKNVICAGTPRAGRKDGSALQEVAQEGNRKRRAESVSKGFR